MSRRTLHHYRVTEARARVSVPQGSKIVSAAKVGNQTRVYVEKIVDEEVVPPMVKMDIMLVGTGQDFEDFDLQFIGTVVDEPFVWHVYGKIHHG